MKLQHLKIYLKNARCRAARDNVPFDLTLQDLVEIAVDECPIFKTAFVWGGSKMGKGKTRPDTPTLDRILPELGYIKGNVAFLSYRANRIKDNGTMQEHYDIADWIWNYIHAKKNTTTPVPEGHYRDSKGRTLHGSILATWAGEDDDDTHHHCGTISGEDLDHRAQASGGDSVGHGGKEMGTFEILESLQNFGIALSAATSHEPTRGHFLSELRERGLVDGTEPEFPKSSD